jgi:hypothetical protein
MEQKTRVFCQIDVQEFHLWRRKGQGHLSPIVILELISRRRKGKGHFDQLLHRDYFLEKEMEETCRFFWQSASLLLKCLLSYSKNDEPKCFHRALQRGLPVLKVPKHETLGSDIFAALKYFWVGDLPKVKYPHALAKWTC